MSPLHLFIPVTGSPNGPSLSPRKMHAGFVFPVAVPVRSFLELVSRFIEQGILFGPLLERPRLVLIRAQRGAEVLLDCNQPFPFLGIARVVLLRGCLG
jgi:hypothetical protein